MASALTDPLSVDKQTLKKLGIKKDVVSPIRKLAYLQNQLEELETVLWRSRVDVIHATRLTESENDTLSAKGHERLAQHLNEVRQFWGGIEMIKVMIDQLLKEYPELKEG